MRIAALKGLQGGDRAEQLRTKAGYVRDAGVFPVTEDPRGKSTETNCNHLAWKIPWTEEPSGLQSMGLQESDMTQ